MSPKSFPPGIHAPSITFFQNTVQQEIDWATQEQHLKHLIDAGCHGVVLSGSSGESCTLGLDEKAQLVKRCRAIATAAGRPDVAITLGCWAGSTREILAQTTTGHQNGADFALVLVPSVFHWSMTQTAIVEFFQDIADRSPMPIIIYNLPAIVGGLEVDSDMLETLSKHPNIAGVKLTCGVIGKITRLASQVPASEFATLCGQSDLLVPALSVGVTGCISGVANLFPKVLINIYQLYVSGKVAEATELQHKLGQPEWGISKSDVCGMKWIICKELGYPADSEHCRRPLPRFTDEAKRERVVRLVGPLLPVEKTL